MGPILVVVSGPPGSGKTTLAHGLAAAIGCPAICRDEIKEGMAHATGGFTAAPGDELTQRTLPVFFGMLNLLVRAGVTTVAEAAFQDHVWRPRLEPLRDLARIRVLHCTTSAELTLARIARREQDSPLRRVHAGPRTAAEREAAYHAFRPVRIDAPALEVDTEDGYRPSFGLILSFIETGLLLATFSACGSLISVTSTWRGGRWRPRPRPAWPTRSGARWRSSRGRTAWSSPATWPTPGTRTSTPRCRSSCGSARCPCTCCRATTTTRAPSSPGSATRGTSATACLPPTWWSTRRSPWSSPIAGCRAARPGGWARTSSPGSTGLWARGRTCPPSSACTTRRCRSRSRSWTA